MQRSASAALRVSQPTQTHPAAPADFGGVRGPEESRAALPSVFRAATVGDPDAARGATGFGGAAGASAAGLTRFAWQTMH